MAADWLVYPTRTTPPPGVTAIPLAWVARPPGVRSVDPPVPYDVSSAPTGVNFIAANAEPAFANPWPSNMIPVTVLPLVTSSRSRSRSAPALGSYVQTPVIAPFFPGAPNVVSRVPFELYRATTYP